MEAEMKSMPLGIAAVMLMLLGALRRRKPAASNSAGRIAATT